MMLLPVNKFLKDKDKVECLSCCPNHWTRTKSVFLSVCPSVCGQTKSRQNVEFVHGQTNVYILRIYTDFFPSVNQSMWKEVWGSKSSPTQLLPLTLTKGIFSKTKTI